MSARHRSRHAPESAGQVLEEIQSRSDRIAEWISDNPLVLLGSAAAILVAAAIWGLVSSSQQEMHERAATALARAQNAYRSEMGARAGELEIPEPANADTAVRAREHALGLYQAVIDGYPETPAATLAALEKGERLVELGRREDAISTWQGALDTASPPLAALLHVRIAALYEDAGRYADAAAEYEEAERAGTPLGPQALADAARCRALAGQEQAAVALLQRIEAEYPDFVVAPHLRARLEELRATETD